MFGNNLKELRAEKNLTQHALADILCISRFTITKYERDERMPDIETLIKIADFFNVSLDYLLDRSKSPKEKIVQKLVQKMDKLNLLENNDQHNNNMINAIISILKISKEISNPMHKERQV